MAIPVELVLIVPLGGVVAVLVYLVRSRARIMRYHDIPTPRINEVTHGEGGYRAMLDTLKRRADR